MIEGSTGGKILNELEFRIESLERENFDLKMQLFYAKNEIKKLKSLPTHNNDGLTSPLAIINGSTKSGASEFDLETVTLNHENKRLRRRVAELETELLQKEVKNGLNQSSMHSPSKQISPSLNKSAALDMSQFEANRKSERQVALAIAEHDNIIIQHLESEVARLTAQHYEDMDLVTNCAEKISALTVAVESRDQQLTQAIERTKDLRATQEISSARESMDISRQPLNRVLDRSFVHEVKPPTDLRNPLSLSSPSKDRAIDINTNSIPSLISTALTVPIPIENAAKLERENQTLRRQIEKERSVLKNHGEILNRVRASAEEITLLEAEEVGRLEREVDRLTADNIKWRERCKLSEANAEHLKQKLNELERQNSPARIAPGVSRYDTADRRMSREREQSLLRSTNKSSRLNESSLREQDLQRLIADKYR